MSYPPEAIIAKYIALRAKKEQIENKHKLELMPTNEALKTLENVLSAMIAANKGENIKTPVGTAFTKKIFSVTATNLPEFVNFAVDTEPKMLDIKPSTNGIQTYMSEYTKRQSRLLENERVPLIIPGIKMDYINLTVVRKA